MPTLNEIAVDPGKAATLTPDEARQLHASCVLVLAALLPQLAGPRSGDSPAPDAQASRRLTPEEAAARFRIPKRWLLAYRDKIPGAVRLSRKTISFDEVRLGRWLERRATPDIKP